MMDAHQLRLERLNSLGSGSPLRALKRMVPSWTQAPSSQPTSSRMDLLAHDLELQKSNGPSVLAWEGLSYDIKGKTILSNISGKVASGQMLAVLGPSGAGKSTLLDILAKRTSAHSGKITMNGIHEFDMSTLSSYVEQNDALLGVLTVQETLYYSARLSLGPSIPRAAINTRVQSTISDLGLAEVASNRIGNAVQRGISGGQKRRVTVGSALVTLPKILLLDEPSSGLDSRSSREVLRAIKNIAIQHDVIVVATIHQPNWETFALFDNVLLMAQGRTIYSGPVTQLATYLERSLSHPVPKHANPADHALDLVNTDFFSDSTEARKHIDHLASTWSAHSKEFAFPSVAIGSELDLGHLDSTMSRRFRRGRRGARSALHQTWILMERNMLNYSRNLLAYGVRMAMYIGMGVLLATVWVDLPQTSVTINDRLSVYFFSVAFLGFMSVAGIPAFLEERQVFVRERMNGLYGPGAYVLANSICTIPYLFLCATLFSVISYWSIGLNPGANQFFRFLAILFLAVYTAESQSAVVAAIIPIFVAALAIASFLNGFWMCVGGYFIKAVNLPRFWYYWAHFIDFQTFAFDFLVVNDLRGLTFNCSLSSSGDCQCDYPSSLVETGVCKIRGEDVLDALDINGISLGLYAGILVIIAIIFRILLYVVLRLKKR